MTWVTTISGTAVDFIDTRPSQIKLGDIAHALARIPRFNGHTVGSIPWNVAQHSVLVTSLMPTSATPTQRLYALLHDAHEAYIGDIPAPLKIALTKNFAEKVPGIVYKDELAALNGITKNLDHAIFTAFGLPPEMMDVTKALVKECDLMALRIERDVLMVKSQREWEIAVPEPPDPLPVLVPFVPAKAAKLFLETFFELFRQRHDIEESRV